MNTRRIYRLADSHGHAFDARVYVEMRTEGWPAEGALYYARRAYTGRRQPYLKGQS